MADTSSALWLLLGGAAGVGVYLVGKKLLEPDYTGGPSHQTLTMNIPAKQPPNSFVNFDQVKQRFADLRDLYHMGPTYKTGPEAIQEIGMLESAALGFATGGAVSQATAAALIADMEDFKGKIMDFMQFQESLKPQPAIAVTGIGRR